MEFSEMLNHFYESFGCCKNMVLSTSLNDKVTSRMMSILLFKGKFYFQTDKEFRKYDQIIKNPNVALCTDNIQIEGICKQLKKPIDNKDFCRLYKKYYRNSYDLYSGLDNEVLFEITPAYIQKWVYENGQPYIECFNITANNYSKSLYAAGEQYV